MLKVEDLVKDYRTGFFRKKVRVLYDVTFSVRGGEVYGFVGPNGAGKTTTFKTILGFGESTSGSIEIMGGDFKDPGIRARMGYLPEAPYFYDYLTGEELLRYMGELHGIRRRELSRKIEEVLEKVNMTHARKLQMRKYSKGMMQRIGFAQALINDADFLILDEPMSGLDPIGRREIREIILGEKGKGKTILLSSHILSDVESLCDRVGVIVDGKVVREGELGELIKEVETDYELLITGVDGSILGKLDGLGVTIERRAGMTALRFPEETKQRVLRLVADLDADVVSLHPLRKSLETVFVQEAMRS